MSRARRRTLSLVGLGAALVTVVAGSISTDAGRDPAAGATQHGAPEPVTAAQVRSTGSRSFDEPGAYSLTRLQLSFGPRPAGSPAQRRLAERLRAMLPRAHFEGLAGGLRNIVGSLPGREPAIVLGAHYDTTPVPGYLGANNSAAGVAAVVEIARELARDRTSRRAQAIRFALFDGEEAPAGFYDFYAQGDRGSKAYVAAHRSSTRELVLLDFIALPHERLPREQGSDPALWGRLRAAAARQRELALFPNQARGAILDDHTPFRQAGIPAIDLIDFDYPCWQKLCDDLTQVSRRNLAAVGSTVLELIRAERSSPAR